MLQDLIKRSSSVVCVKSRLIDHTYIRRDRLQSFWDRELVKRRRRHNASEGEAVGKEGCPGEEGRVSGHEESGEGSGGA
jgi:hypothetical protein